MLIRVYFKSFSIVVIIFISIIILPFYSRAQSEWDSYYSSFDQLSVQTNFLLNRAFFVHESVEPFLLNSSMTDLSQRLIFSSAYEWGVLYNNLDSTDINDPEFLLPINTFYTSQLEDDPTIPIGILFFDTDYLHIDSIQYYYDDVTNVISPNAPIDIVNIFAISNLRQEVYFKDVIFEIDPSIYFTNRVDDVLGMEINFDDGNGYQYFPFSTTDIPVHYDAGGEKSITYKLITDQDTLISFSILNVVSYVSEDLNSETSTVLPSGEVSKAFYNTYLGCDNVLDRPILVIEGFDPLNKGNPKKTHDKYNKNELWEVIHAAGYDLITVAFENNNDSIQNNAQILKDVIREINYKKIGHYENIIIGESMGGLIARIALKEMEDQNETHDTRLYVSFDSPHKGSNIPLSLQSFADGALNNWLSKVIFNTVDFISFITFGEILGGFDSSLDDFEETVNANNSIAARQMMVRHKSYEHLHNQNFLDFQEYLNNIGFPNNLRKVALINGSNNSIQQIDGSGNLEIGEKYLDLDYDVGIIGTGFRAYAEVSPINEDTVQVSLIRLRGFFISVVNKKGIFSFFDKPYDISPGGTQGFGNVNFSFVPSVSSIALDNNIISSPNGLFHFKENSTMPIRTKKGLVLNGLTPFDDIYAQGDNTKHIKFDMIEDLSNKLFEREFMFDDYYLQNRIFKTNEIKYFHGNTSVTVGEDVNPAQWQQLGDEKLIDKSKVELDPNAEVRITAGKTIKLSPGTIVNNGARMNAKIVSLPSSCPQNKTHEDKLLTTHVVSPPVINIVEFPNGGYEFNVANKSKFNSKINYDWVLKGMDKEICGNGEVLITNQLPDGQYKITCSFYNGKRTSSRAFEVKNKIEKLNNEKFVSQSDYIEHINIDYQVFPNPATDRVFFMYNLPEKCLTSVKIMNIDGKESIILVNEIQNEGMYEYVFDVSKLKSGIYFFEVRIKDEVRTTKLILF